MSKKINFWIRCPQTNEYGRFDSVSTFFFLSENSIKLDENIKRSIREHPNYLRLTFDDYFPNRCNISVSNNWIRNPFQGNVCSETSLNILEKLIGLSRDSSLEAIFKDRSLIDFWLGIQNEYPVLSKKAIEVLLPFCITYLCEKGFSTYTYLKDKYRNGLNAEPDLRPKLPDIEPNFESLCSIKRLQISH
ncbi:zinc finger BED domain-containing protein 5-like [Centruroides vittatus]|uniref:zinc finger BED domain-containing protein 5-like n=1 Tax=Centruroides vittatus TaxID=120091 RepID=UPI0035109A91